MCHISYFLQYTTVESQICHGTDGCGIWIYYYFYSSFSLISSSVSPSNPNPLLSNPTLSLCLPLPVSLGTVTLLGPSASVLTKTLTFSAFKDPIPWLIVLAFFFARRFIKIGLRNRIAYQLVVGANLTFNMIN